ncbi:hypothetical protein [Ochrovirga pacifica]|uniref:hypothetical protein n=1 Tax=Ochrovirga pacifica TaxID=1042376 RepID=UPI0002559D9E|nr:hypothetical protein [Ochrovirga pacifica]
MKFILRYILFFFLFSSTAYTQQIQLLSPQQTYVAGSNITLKFKNLKNTSARLYISNSYANTIVAPTVINTMTTYALPSFITKKSGWLYWRLQTDQQTIEGNLKILPVQFTHKIETYLGPPSIVVGFDDKSMLVTIPSDSLNNPLLPNTAVTIKKRLHNRLDSTNVKTDGMIAYKYIYGSTKAGRALLSAECLNLTSKEMSLEILPAPPVDFTISYQRVHEYADGNQITNFETEPITDLYGNTIADGTLVNFSIKNKSGVLLQTQAPTINGVANSQLIHPDHEDLWNVKAFVDGFSQSNLLEIPFKKAIEDFKAIYHPHKKSVTVGPFKSFMNQVLPDGLIVHLTLSHKNQLLKTFTQQSEKGFVTFNLKNFVGPNKQYNIRIETAELVKHLEIETYDN